MGEPDVLLVFYCQGPLDALIRGIASRLDMSYRSCASPEEVGSLLELGSPAVVIIGREQVDDADLCLMRRASLCPGVFVICVADVLTHESTCTALHAGAISCMSTEAALEMLHDVVTRIRSHVRTLLQNAVPSRKEIELGQGLRLIVPDYKITDGLLESRLPRTPGRLLERLAHSPGRVVAYETLIREAWEKHEKVRREALHQQIHILKGVLEVYGVSHRIQCRRGIGYLLDPTGERICP